MDPFGYLENREGAENLQHQRYFSLQYELVEGLPGTEYDAVEYYLGVAKGQSEVDSPWRLETFPGLGGRARTDSRHAEYQDTAFVNNIWADYQGAACTYGQWIPDIDHDSSLAESKTVWYPRVMSPIPPSPSPLSPPTKEVDDLSEKTPIEEDARGRGPYTNREILEVSSTLKNQNPRWSSLPRTYVILDRIGCLDVFDNFIEAGFSDYMFPVTEALIPRCLPRSKRSDFMETQDLIMNYSTDLEEGNHCYFKGDEGPQLKTEQALGAGAFGRVDKVRSLTSHEVYARKRVRRSTKFTTKTAEQMKQLVAEIEVLKCLDHHHVVKFVGSYTDPKYVGFIMSPVAEMDLKAYLRQADEHREELCSFFGCLAQALEYLHRQKVRHKDIKPSNILVKDGKAFLTDFGLSLDFKDTDESTTNSVVKGWTPRYGALEVAMFKPRNTSSDIWSLGVVFLEMVVVLKGRSIEYMNEFFEANGKRNRYAFANRHAVPRLIAELERTGSSSDNVVLQWIQRMLKVKPALRPTARRLVASIATASATEEGRPAFFCGECCVSLDEDSGSDEEDDWERVDIASDDED